MAVVTRHTREGGVLLITLWMVLTWGCGKLSYTDAGGREAAVDKAVDRAVDSAAPGCTNGKEDGDETDVDCGGKTCSKRCAISKKCKTGRDCMSGLCQSSSSGAATCTIPKMKWIKVVAGTFDMGSPTGESCRDTDEDSHNVKLSRAFEISNIEVTQAQFSARMGYNPSTYSCSNCPVETVAWHAAAAYCNALSTEAGLPSCYSCSSQTVNKMLKWSCDNDKSYAKSKIYKCPGFRLPTEAEFEYAYRANTDWPYYIGKNESTKCTSCDKKNPDLMLNIIGWYCGNSMAQPNPVGTKIPNTWGLYDMAGNVTEWCHDWYDKYSFVPGNTLLDPWGAEKSNTRVVRGGDTGDKAQSLRAAFRSDLKPTVTMASVGFRCARILVPNSN